MKTLLIIGCLIALVWVGVANSPKGGTRHVGSVAESVYVAGAVLDGRVLSNAVVTEWHGKPMVDEAMPFAYGVQTKTLIGTLTRDVIGRGGAVCAAIHPDGHQCESDGKGGYITHD